MTERSNWQPRVSKAVGVPPVADHQEGGVIVLMDVFSVANRVNARRIALFNNRDPHYPQGEIFIVVVAQLPFRAQRGRLILLLLASLIFSRNHSSNSSMANHTNTSTTPRLWDSIKVIRYLHLGVRDPRTSMLLDPELAVAAQDRAEKRIRGKLQAKLTQ